MPLNPPSVTSLDVAIIDGDFAGVRAALSAHVPLSKSVRGQFPLVWAAEALLYRGRLAGPDTDKTDHLAIVEFLLKKGAWKALPKETRAGFLPLMIEASHLGELGMGGPARLLALIERLKPYGLDVDGTNAKGETALFPAIQSGLGRWTAALIGVGVDPCKPNSEGRYPHENPPITGGRWDDLLELLAGQVRAKDRGLALERAPATSARTRPRA